MSAFPREPSQKRTCEIFRCIKFIPICVLQRATINVDDHFVLTSAQIDVTSWTKELQIKHGKTWSGSFMMTFKQSTAVLAYVILFLCLGSELWFSSAGALPRAAQPLFCSQTLVWFNFFASIVYGIWRGNGCNGYSDFCLRNVILLHFFCFGPCCKHLALVRQMFSLCLNFCFQNGVTTFECRGHMAKLLSLLLPALLYQVRGGKLLLDRTGVLDLNIQTQDTHKTDPQNFHQNLNWNWSPS